MLPSREELNTPAPHPVFYVRHASHSLASMMDVTTPTSLILANFSYANSNSSSISEEGLFFPSHNASGEEAADSNSSGGGMNAADASMYEKPWPPLKTSLPMIVLLCAVYLVILLLGTVNNALVVSVIYRNPQMRTVTNYFIANLAVADILVSILVVPTLLSSIFREWWYGSFVCKAAPYLQGVAASTSVNTLAAIAIERYLAIFYPQTSRLTPRAACIMIGIIWMVPMCIFIPWLIVYVQKIYVIQGFTYVTCHADWRSMENRKMYTLGAVFLTCYLIPLIFIAIFYLLIGIRVWKRRVHGIRGSRAERNINRSKTRILRMLVMVFVMFALSWLPLYAIELRLLFGHTPEPKEKTLLKDYLIPIAQWLGASNSCVNPFIYCYFSTNFRNSIFQVLRSRTCCGKITT